MNQALPVFQVPCEHYPWALPFLDASQPYSEVETATAIILQGWEAKDLC